MAQTADSVSRAHGSGHLFAPRRLTLTEQSEQTPSLRFRPRLRRGSFVLTLIRGSLQMGHPWPSAAQSASMPIAPRISARTQPSPTSQSAVSALSRKKARQCRCLTGWPDDLCITMSAERRNDQSDLKHADHAHACAQRYTQILLQPRSLWETIVHPQKVLQAPSVRIPPLALSAHILILFKN